MKMTEYRKAGAKGVRGNVFPVVLPVVLCLLALSASAFASSRPLWVYAEDGAYAAIDLSQAPLVKALGASLERHDALEAEPARKEQWLAQGEAHIVVLGTPGEGDVARKTMGFTYGIDTGKKEAYRLGFGRFRGDVGFVETRFNPWLYSNRVDDHADSTLLVRIGGTTPKGVELAAAAFVQGLNNGLVLGPGAQRVEETILDLDPSVEPPPAQPERIGDLVLAGWTQCPAQEYRAMLDLGAQKEPRRMWRVKYLAPDALATASDAAWIFGPQAMSWGNAVTIAEFDDPADAQRTWEGIARQKGVKREGSVLTVPFPTDEAMPKSLGTIRYRVEGKRLVADGTVP